MQSRDQLEKNSLAPPHPGAALFHERENGRLQSAKCLEGLTHEDRRAMTVPKRFVRTTGAVARVLRVRHHRTRRSWKWLDQVINEPIWVAPHHHAIERFDARYLTETDDLR